MRNYLLVIVFCLFATTIFAQNNLTGTWNTGEQNTLVKIHEVDSVYVGEIISSDNPEVKLGKVIVKDFKTGRR
jgi:predicted small secreted protein